MKNQFLVVDDNAMVCRATARLVEHVTGRVTQCCASAEEALRIFKDAPEGEFSCVISDYEMPGMNGLELGCFLRALCPGICLMLMTGNPGAPTLADIRRHGFDCLLAKPLDLAIIKEALRHILPPLNNSPSPGTQYLYGDGVSFFQRSGGFQSAVA